MGCEPELLTGRPCDSSGCAASTDPSVSFCPPRLPPTNHEGGGYMRSLALDVQRDFCQVAIKQGGELRSAGRIKTSVAGLELFAHSLGADDRVALEATGPANAIADILEPHVARRRQGPRRRTLSDRAGRS